jgi:hypothetical protein
MIEKLNKDEMPAILPLSRKGNTVLRVMLLQLEVGEGLFLPKEDWKAKNGPRFIVAGVTKPTVSATSLAGRPMARGGCLDGRPEAISNCLHRCFHAIIEIFLQRMQLTN